MAYSVTYETLVAEILGFVDEGDGDEFMDALDGIIRRAQDQVQRDLDLSIWRTFVNHHFSANSNVLARDPEWLRVLSLYLPDEGAFVERRSYDYVRAYGGTGVPRCYAEKSETELYVAPKPINNVNVEIETHKRLPALSDENPENWITRNCADLLLLQCLIGAENWLIAPERVKEFAGLYQLALQGARHELRGIAREDYTPVRRPARPAVAPAQAAPAEGSA